MYVRWLGAFRKNFSLADSIEFELSRTTEAACEKFKKTSEIYSKVGLLCDPKFIVKDFTGDCWSEYDKKGKLHKNRNPRHAGIKSKHKESWVKPGGFCGIVLKVPFDNLPGYIQDQLERKIWKYSFPVYVLSSGSKRAELIPAKIPITRKFKKRKNRGCWII